VLAQPLGPHDLRCGPFEQDAPHLVAVTVERNEGCLLGAPRPIPERVEDQFAGGIEALVESPGRSESNGWRIVRERGGQCRHRVTHALVDRRDRLHRGRSNDRRAVGEKRRHLG